jgi:hypothetical protein
MTPVLTVAMDCGHLESRLDRLGNSERKARKTFGAGRCRRETEVTVRGLASPPAARARWFD